MAEDYGLVRAPVLVADPKADRFVSDSEFSLKDLFQTKLTVVLLHYAVALAGRVLKSLAVHNRHCATSVRDEILALQNTSGQAHARSICPEHRCQKIMSDGQ